MAIIRKQQRSKRVIDLTGPNGNVFFLINQARMWGKQLNLDIVKIQEEMMASDYENAIEVFDKYFGSVCDLER